MSLFSPLVVGDFTISVRVTIFRRGLLLDRGADLEMKDEGFGSRAQEVEDEDFWVAGAPGGFL